MQEKERDKYIESKMEHSCIFQNVYNPFQNRLVGQGAHDVSYCYLPGGSISQKMTNLEYDHNLVF